MRFVAVMISLACALVARPARPSEPGEWTILVYAVADAPGIARSVRTRLKALEREPWLKPGARVRIVVQHDEHGHDLNGRYLVGHVVHPKETGGLDTPPIPESEIRALDPDFRYGERDSASPAAVRAFLAWGIRAFPARHYALVLMGQAEDAGSVLSDHWGEKGRLAPPSRLGHRDLRAAIEEVQRDEAVKAAGGTLDVLVLDTKGAGQLDSLVEYRHLFHYTVASSVDRAPELFPGDALAEFLAAAAAPGTVDVERAWLRPWIARHAEREARVGSRAADIRFRDGAEAFAIRNAGLDAVSDVFTRLVNDLPQETSEEWRAGKLDAIARLGDGARHGDLAALARALDGYFEEKADGLAGDSWRAQRFRNARNRLAALSAALGAEAKDPSSEPVVIAHPKATAAWAHIQIDELAPRELALCVALRSLALQNESSARIAPELLGATGNRLRPSEIDCRELYGRARKGLAATRAARGVPARGFFGVTARWPRGILARVNETAGVDGGVTSRVLSLWIPREGRTLDRRARLKLPGTTTIRIEYAGGGPDRPRRLGSALVETEGFTVMTPEGDGASSALYVAEAHTHGTLFKRGIGIYLSPERDLGRGK